MNFEKVRFNYLEHLNKQIKRIKLKPFVADNKEDIYRFLDRYLSLRKRKVSFRLFNIESIDISASTLFQIERYELDAIFGKVAYVSNPLAFVDDMASKPVGKVEHYATEEACWKAERQFDPVPWIPMGQPVEALPVPTLEEAEEAFEKVLERWGFAPM